jgi:hypothetical protein
MKLDLEEMLLEMDGKFSFITSGQGVQILNLIHDGQDAAAQKLAETWIEEANED